MSIVDDIGGGLVRACVSSPPWHVVFDDSLLISSVSVLISLLSISLLSLSIFLLFPSFGHLIRSSPSISLSIFPELDLFPPRSRSTSPPCSSSFAFHFP